MPKTEPLKDEILESIHANNLDQAQQLCETWLQDTPDSPTPYHMRGVIAYRQGDSDLAQTFFHRALQCHPQHCDSLCDLGLIAAQQQQLGVATAYFEQVLDLEANHFYANLNLARLKQQQGEYFVAREHYRRLNHYYCEHQEVLFGLGLTEQSTGNYATAGEHLQQLLHLAPNHYEAWYHLGLIYLQANALTQAAECFERSLREEPNFAAACLGQAQCSIMVQDYHRGIRWLNQALICAEIGWPQLIKCLTLLLYCYQQRLVWDKIPGLSKQLISSINEYQDNGWHWTIDPFPTLAMSLPWPTQCSIAQNHATYIQNSVQTLPFQAAANDRSMIKIGYLSADFRKHPVSLLLHDTFKEHDRAKFQIYAYYTHPQRDEFTTHIEQSVDKFVCLHEHSDKQAAEIIRADEIDILVDLSGYTKGARPRILAYRPAPIQATHALGYCAPCGADYIDYFIADTVISTKSHPTQEQTLRLDDSAFIYAGADPILSEVSRTEFSLPETGFVYCCFTMPYRIEAALFTCWMEILTQTEQSVLWLYAHTSEHQQRLKQLAEKQQVDPTRLVFLSQNELTSNWAHQHADLWLDTWNVSGGTGALLALRAGLPILTLCGQSPHNRTTASILQALPAVQLITLDQKAYQEQAIFWAQHPTQFDQLTCHLKDCLNTTPLFNRQQYCINLEQVYLQMLAGTD